jgi:uncharacterized SAM-binding protein YcdF (DUF218 family)
LSVGLLWSNEVIEPDMSVRNKAAITVGGGLWLFVLGFVLFAAWVNRIPEQSDGRADAIVVLTGGSSRIAEGAKLLKDKRGGRLLISGINSQTGRESVLKLTGLPSTQFNCCVDLGYSALDTIGNARETGSWVSERRYNSLIVVTSRTHMPRSLAELERALPGVKLIPHPVMSTANSHSPWWLSYAATRVIVSEYIKYIPSAAKLMVSRALSTFDGRSIAEMPKEPYSPT